MSTAKPPISEAANVADTARRDVAEEDVIEALRTCYDPEIPANIYDLGLVYKIHVEREGRVEVDMTLTAPGCPVADAIVAEVEAKVRALPGVEVAKVNLVWEPPWEMAMMSEDTRLSLNLW